MTAGRRNRRLRLAKASRAPDAKGVTFVQPVLVGEVRLQRVDPRHRLRQASWRGLRPDKKPDEVVRRMKWVTYRGDSGERTSVLSGDAIRATAPGVTLLDLVAAARRAAEAGGGGVSRPRRTSWAEVTLIPGADPAPAVDPRFSYAFLDHMRNCQAVIGSRARPARRRLGIASPRSCLRLSHHDGSRTPIDDVRWRREVPSQDFEWEITPGGHRNRCRSKDSAISKVEQAIIDFTFGSDWSTRGAVAAAGGPAGDRTGHGKDSGVTLGPSLVTPTSSSRTGAPGIRLEPSSGLAKSRRFGQQPEIGSGSTDQMD